MNVFQVEHYNPGCDKPLIMPVIVMPNTPEAVGDAQIRANGLLDLPWLDETPAHDGVAVIVGGGPSIDDCEEQIHRLIGEGATMFGLNAASCWLSERGWGPDYQVIVDAKEETSALVDVEAIERLYASQVHPETAKYATMLFHMANVGITDLLPQDRVEAGGFTLIGGGVSVGITALCVAYTMGHRKFHLFGYDSSDRDGATHAYPQRMNALIPKIRVEWAGKWYTASMPMKLQAEAFPKFAQELIAQGCEITVHGDGLLPAMWHIEPMTEREKYQRLWGRGDYRRWSPGEDAVEDFLALAQPDGQIIDFGCGTGRAALKMAEAGHNVLLIDFTDNCRDKAAMGLPFVQWDLTRPIPVAAPYGYCTDVMEHIPTDQVETVIRNIMASAEKVFFQIATVPDKFGAVIGQTLHLTVQDHQWWAGKFFAYQIEWMDCTEAHSSFYVKRIANA